MGDVLREGEPCILIDGRGRSYLTHLKTGSQFHYHRGSLAHDLIIGSEEGARLESTLGSGLTVLRPRLADYVLRMERGPAVLYPKDAGAVLVWGDVGAGMTVVEAGTGSGGLAMVLARAVGPTGRLVSVERREDHAALAADRINQFFGEIPDHVELRVGEVEPVIGEIGPDRIVLDLPEPWHSVEPAADHLEGGGVFCAYLPTVPQVQQLREAMGRTRAFIETSTFEVLHREWSVEGRSVRPEHRMVGHTGFITVGRKRSRA